MFMQVGKLRPGQVIDAKVRGFIHNSSVSPSQYSHYIRYYYAFLFSRVTRIRVS